MEPAKHQSPKMDKNQTGINYRAGTWHSPDWSAIKSYRIGRPQILFFIFGLPVSGSTIGTLLHAKINPKDCQVEEPLVIQGFSNFLRGVSSDYGKPRVLDVSNCNVMYRRNICGKKALTNANLWVGSWAVWVQLPNLQSWTHPMVVCITWRCHSNRVLPIKVYIPTMTTTLTPMQC